MYYYTSIYILFFFFFSKFNANKYLSLFFSLILQWTYNEIFQVLWNSYYSYYILRSYFEIDLQKINFM